MLCLKSGTQAFTTRQGALMRSVCCVFVAVGEMIKLDHLSCFAESLLLACLSVTGSRATRTHN